MSEKKYQIGSGLSISDNDRTFTKTINGDSWSLKIPLPPTKMAIARRTIELSGGYTKDQIGESEFEYIRSCVTIQSVLSDSPDWWDGVDNCTDDNLISELWRFYLDSENEFASKLKTVRKSKSLGKP